MRRPGLSFGSKKFGAIIFFINLFADLYLDHFFWTMKTSAVIVWVSQLQQKRRECRIRFHCHRNILGAQIKKAFSDQFTGDDSDQHYINHPHIINDNLSWSFVELRRPFLINWIKMGSTWWICYHPYQHHDPPLISSWLISNKTILIALSHW